MKDRPSTLPRRVRDRPWWLRLAPFLLAERAASAGLALLVLAGALLTALAPLPLKWIVDSVLAAKPLSRSARWLEALPGASTPAGLLSWLALGTLAIHAAGVLQRIAQGRLQCALGNRLTQALGVALFDHLQRLSLAFHGRRHSGDLLRRVTTDSACLQKLLLGLVLPLLASLLTLAAMFVVMWRMSPSLSLVALLLVPLLGAVVLVFARPMGERGHVQSQLEGERSAVAEQTLTALPVIQAFGREALEDLHFRDVSERACAAGLRATLIELQFGLGVNGLTALGTAALMVAGGLQVLAGTLSVGDLVVFLAYLSSFFAPLDTLALAGSAYASAAAGARRVLEMLDVEQEVRDAPGAAPLSRSRETRGAHVRIEGVTVGYEPGHPVLRSVSLDARPGRSVALVGATGAGKTTLASLVLRFLDPWQGRVTLDGQDVREIQLASLRASVALVPQEPFLLPLSVRENIAYGRPEATHGEIVAAAAAANADDFVRELPQGYDTVLGERGATLSAGQKQRISLARALLRDAPVLVLDEPTSALDVETEALVLEALGRLTKGRTVFVLAHRLSTIRSADEIAVLEDGEIVERGTHEELLAHDGAYRRFHDARSGRALVPEGRS